MHSFLKMIIMFFWVSCAGMNLLSMDNQRDEAEELAWQAELAREIVIARDVFLQASIDGNHVLQERILGLFPIEHHDDIKLFAACRAEWLARHDVTIAVNAYVNALIRRDEAFRDRIGELIDDNQYKVNLITAVNAKLLEDDPFVVPVTTEPIRTEQSLQDNQDVGDLRSSDFISEANASAMSDEVRNFGFVEDDSEVCWTYDVSDGFDNAWLLIHKSVIN